jgi:hypothetical protein
MSDSDLGWARHPSYPYSVNHPFVSVSIPIQFTLALRCRVSLHNRGQGNNAKSVGDIAVKTLLR